MEQLGCPFVAVNLSVGLSLSMPSIALKVAGMQCAVHVHVLHKPLGASVRAAGMACWF